MNYLLVFGIGLVAGVFSGMFGIGGGLIIVPALMFLCGLGPKQAVGTSMAALVPPAGLLAAIEYYRNGDVRISYAALISAGLFLAAFFGAKITIGIEPQVFRKLYAGFLIVVAVYMLVKK